ncbi:MAG: ribosome maturation factor RimP [Gammaproteobacteria bacterium]|jgi:ribosome maturation factor RimP|tara:strand:- start:4191 stop:4697 length:507 start_codon:yes stop_codon:yes gene_type:complete
MTQSPFRGYFIGYLKMNDLEEKLYLALNEMLEKKEMRVLNVSVNKKTSGQDIQIIIDSSSGVNLDDCTFASKIAGDIIKIDNLYDDNFNLEVSSPGINRQLFSIDDFLLYKGYKVKIKLKLAVENQKKIIGTIGNIKDQNILIATDNKDIIIDFNNIKKANLQRDIKI